MQQTVFHCGFPALRKNQVALGSGEVGQLTAFKVKGIEYIVLGDKHK